MNDEETLRLSKRMSELGLCSRREADDWIARGLVSVDGKKITELGTKVTRSQTVTVDAKAKKEQGSRVTIVYHKPLGIVSSQAEDGYKPAVAMISRDSHWEADPSKTRFSPAQLKSLVPAGRLDINSTGLLVLTQDGRIAKKLIGEDSTITKEYLVRVAPLDASFRESDLEKMRHGLKLDGKPLKPAKVERINADQLKITLVEGKKRQIRRMCDAVGLKVLALKRVAVGNVKLSRLPLGKWRYLAENESF